MNPSLHRNVPAKAPLALPFLMLVAVAAACGAPADGELQVPSDNTASELTSSGGDTIAARALIPFTLVKDEIGAAGQAETRHLFTSELAYRSYFGHAAPADVNFATDWVFFYSAGERKSGGYTAELRSVTRAGTELSFVTSLTSPGSSCITTAAITKPFVLARFPKQAGLRSVQYYRADRVQECSTSACAAALCPPGTRCVEEQVVCVKEPCEPQARCVATPEVSCGGISGKACPGAGLCKDDPRDTCDPNTGGRDCSGLCECAPTALCRTGRWDSSPAVCACVP